MKHNNINEGSFIVFEGIDCSGKSSQIQRLYSFLTSHNYNVIMTKEPGGTPFAEELRTLLKHSASNLSTKTELLGMLTARRDHMDTVIKPALKSGAIVLCDRFYGSTLSYQNPETFLTRDELSLLEDLSFDSLYPDLTIVFDISIEESLKRKQNRTSDIHDRFELIDRLRTAHKSYQNLIKYPNSNNPIIHINAEHSEGDVFLRILTLLKPLGIEFNEKTK